MRFLVITAILLSFNTAFSQNSDKNPWEKVQYNFESLFKESEFNSKSCMQTQKDFTACVLALDYLGKLLPEPMQIKIEAGAQDQMTLVKDNRNQPMSDEDYQAYKESIGAIFGSVSVEDLDPHFDNLYELAQTIETDVPAFLAARTYNTYLENAYDAHSAIQPIEILMPPPSQPNKYFGIGSQVNYVKTLEIEDEYAIFLNPMDGSPAAKAGIKKGDLIYAVNGVSVKHIIAEDEDLGEVANEKLTTAVEMIKGQKDTVVKLKIKRLCTGLEEEIEVTRGPIEYTDKDIKEESYYVGFNDLNADPKALECAQDHKPQAGEKQALYIPIRDFPQANSFDDSLCKKFYDLQQEDMKNEDSLGLIVDLRNNPGGSLREVLCMLDTVIESDEMVLGQYPVERGVVQNTQLRGQPFGAFKSVVPNTYTKSIVVLINGGSASASEIFSGVVQDMKRGWVLGGKSFGKGSVQTVRGHSYFAEQPNLGNASAPTVTKLSGRQTDMAIKKTTAIYVLPSGRSPQHKGVTPDLSFSLNMMGDEIEENDSHRTEASLNGTIHGFDNIDWEQSRPGLVNEVSECTQQRDSLGEKFLENKENIPDLIAKNIGRFTNYHDLVARDLLNCEFERIFEAANEDDSTTPQ